MNELLVNKVVLTDTGVAAGNTNLYSSNGLLYYNDHAIAPLTGITGNANEIIMVEIPLTSGVTDQQIVFPQSYLTVPKVVYSIRGQNKAEILGHQISDLSTGYVQISFSHPIPDDQYTLFLFAWKSTNYLTLTGTAYEINAIHQAGAVRVDSVYGSVGGIRNRPDVPYQTLAQGVAAASPGDTIYFGSGFYSGQTISTNNLNFVFEDGAKIVTPVTLAANVTGNFYNLQLSITDTNQTSALTVNSNSRAIFKDGNYISMPIGGTTSRSSVAGVGSIELFGSLYHSHYINPTVNTIHRNPSVYNSGVVAISPFGANYTGGSGVNNVYSFNSIDSGIAFASVNQKLIVAPGTYPGFTLTKNLSLEFEDGAIISSPSTIKANVTGTLKNFVQNITSIDPVTGVGIILESNSFLNFDGSNKINFPNTSNQSFAAISGIGKVYARGNVYYGVGISNSVNFNSEPYKLVVKGTGLSLPSGVNNTISFSNIQSAVNFAPINSTVTVDSGNWSGFSNSTANLFFSFHDKAIVTSPIIVNANTYFHNLTYNGVSNTGVNYAVVIANSGVTGFFKESNVINVPVLQSPYLVDFSGNSLYKITDAFTNNFYITSSGSGYYISGVGTAYVSGFASSGITTYPAYSVSGIGTTVITQLISNANTFSSITNALLPATLNSGAYFGATPTYYLQ